MRKIFTLEIFRKSHDDNKSREKLSFSFQPWQVDSKNRLPTEGWRVTIAASIDPTAHFTEFLLWLENSQDFSSSHGGDDFLTCTEHNDTRNTEMRFRRTTGQSAERASRDHKYSCTEFSCWCSRLQHRRTRSLVFEPIHSDRGNFSFSHISLVTQFSVHRR